jgi:hypothetical protein
MARICVWSAMLLALIGCSKEMHSQAKTSAATESAATGSVASSDTASSLDEIAESSSDDRTDVAAEQKAAGPTSVKRPVAPNRGISRKIVYTADLDLAVESFDGTPERITALTQEFDGYIARSNMQGSAGSPRGGQWTLRIPGENFDRFLLAAKGLGEIRRSSSNSQDVSAEYYDIEARIRNRKQEEERLLKHLNTSTNRLDEILTIEREISRVRGEVEQLTGRLNVLHDVSQLATINLRIDEIRTFVPPAASTYSDRVAQAWFGSLRSLSGLGQAVSIGLVMGAPWLVALGLPVMLPAAFFLRRYRRRSLA